MVIISVQWPPNVDGVQTCPTMNSSSSTSSTEDETDTVLNEPSAKATKKRSSAYDHNFEQHLIDHGIYPNNYHLFEDGGGPRPSNEKEIRDRLAHPRPSLSHVSDDVFLGFTRNVKQARTEQMVMIKSFPALLGDANISSSGGLPFTNLEPLTDGSLAVATPDFYDGARPETIDRRVREELSSYITPSTQGQAPVLPNLFIEAKGQHGSEVVATRQAQYDAALGARGIHKIRSFGTVAVPVYDNNAYTITSTYYNGHLRLYTTHPTQPAEPGKPSEYHMTQVGGWDLIGSVGQFREGISAFRNARHWAKEQRDRIIAAANARTSSRQVETTSALFVDNQLSLSTQPLESDRLNHELEPEVREDSRSSRQRPKRRTEKRRSERKSKKRGGGKISAAAHRKSSQDGQK